MNSQFLVAHDFGTGTSIHVSGQQLPPEQVTCLSRAASPVSCPRGSQHPSSLLQVTSSLSLSWESSFVTPDIRVASSKSPSLFSPLLCCICAVEIRVDGGRKRKIWLQGFFSWHKRNPCCVFASLKVSPCSPHLCYSNLLFLLLIFWLLIVFLHFSSVIFIVSLLSS